MGSRNRHRTHTRFTHTNDQDQRPMGEETQPLKNRAPRTENRDTDARARPHQPRLTPVPTRRLTQKRLPQANPTHPPPAHIIPIPRHGLYFAGTVAGRRQTTSDADDEDVTGNCDSDSAPSKLNPSSLSCRSFLHLGRMWMATRAYASPVLPDRLPPSPAAAVPSTTAPPALRRLPLPTAFHTSLSSSSAQAAKLASPSSARRRPRFPKRVRGRPARAGRACWR